MVPLAATLAASVVVQKVDESTKENDDKLANDLGRASATKTLEKFGDDIAISFSEEDVALIGGPFLVFFDALLEKLYSIHIDHMFPNAAEVQANVDNQDNNWNFLQDINNVPVNRLSSQGYVSIGSEPCRTRPILPWQHQRKGMWWEDAKAKECSGLNKAVEGSLMGFVKALSKPN